MWSRKSPCFKTVWLWQWSRQAQSTHITFKCLAHRSPFHELSVFSWLETCIYEAIYKGTNSPSLPIRTVFPSRRQSGQCVRVDRSLARSVNIKNRRPYSSVYLLVYLDGLRLTSNCTQRQVAKFYWKNLALLSQKQMLTRTSGLAEW
jgi:hypothetical protein